LPDPRLPAVRCITPRSRLAASDWLAGHSSDYLARLDRLRFPLLQQPQQRIRIGFKLLQRLAINARNQSSDQPARLAHFDNHDQTGALIKRGQRAAQVALRGEPWSTDSPLRSG